MSAKWPGLPAFLAHLAIGACLAMPVNTFVQYYFNGRLMAQLPQWDASVYTHAAIMPMDVLGVRFTALLCTTEPLTVSDDGYLELKNPTTAIMATGVIANRVHVRWKWLEGANDYDAGVWNTSAAAVIWSNYDLVDAAGNVYLKASEPVPRVKPEADPLWETLFEGEVVTAKPTYALNGSIATVPVASSPLFAGNDGIQLTINGVSAIYTAVDTTSSGIASAYIGNSWLDMIPSTPVEDGGGDYYLSTMGPSLSAAKTYLVTRSPGTYQVKIERPLFDPVAYLYNGVKLPEKPDFPITSDPIPGQPDRTQEYQYQFIYQLTEETVVYSFIRNIGKTLAGINIYGIGSGDVVEFKLEGDTWTLLHMATNDGLAYLDTIIWSNHDIPDADGNVYLAASEPVPVYA